MKKFFLCIFFVTLFCAGAHAETVEVTYTMPGLWSDCDGYNYDMILDASGNHYNIGYGSYYPAGNWWYVKYAFPDYNGSGNARCKEHLINVTTSSSITVSSFGIAGESTTNTVGTWYYPGTTIERSTSHSFKVNDTSFYATNTNISFTAYDSYGLKNLDYVRIGHVTSPLLRIGFDNEIVYNGPLFGASLTVVCPYDTGTDDLATTAQLNTAVADLKSTIEANAVTSVDYTALLNSINSSMSSIKQALTTNDTYSDGTATLYYYVRYMYYNLQSVNNKLSDVNSTLDNMDSTLSLLNSTLSNIYSTLVSMEATLSNIDQNLQYIADEYRAQDQLGQAAASAAGDQTQDTLSNSQSGLSGISSTITDSGSTFTDLSGNGFSGFLGATFGTILTAAPSGSTLTIKKWLLLFITLSAVLILVQVLLKGGGDD